VLREQRKENRKDKEKVRRKQGSTVDWLTQHGGRNGESMWGKWTAQKAQAAAAAYRIDKQKKEKRRKEKKKGGLAYTQERAVTKRVPEKKAKEPDQ